MRVYFLRHGIATEPEGYTGTDFERPLTDEGREKMEREAKAIERLDLEIDVVLTSPLVRAKETATIVAERLGLRVTDDERLDPSFDRARLTAILRDREASSGIMVVGHEPSMSETIGDLVGGAAIEFKKGGLACVEVDAPDSDGVLLWLVSPKVLLA